MDIHPVVFKVRRLLHSLLKADGVYVLAVSGGADSLVLADGCAWLQQQGWGRYTVCHVEHGLRGGESLADMELVREFCRLRQLDCVCRSVDVRSLSQKEHLSLEDAARRLRYEALRRTAAQRGAGYIVTAHHRDDQAETVLLRLLRGSGTEGLSGMAPQKEDVLRPFLSLDRELLERYCQVRQIEYCHDSTNDDTAYTRNRVRLELLPYLRQRFNREITPALARTAALLREDAECLERLAAQVYGELAAAQKDGSIAVDATELAALPVALQTRVLRRAYFALGGRELTYERSRALLELCRRRCGGKVLQLPEGIRAHYLHRRIILFKV